MASIGYICVPRDLRNHWLWQQEKRLRMWLDLVMLASWYDTSIVIGKNIIVVKRGQYLTSIRNLSRIWGCSRQTTTNFLKLLEQTGMIMCEIKLKNSLISIKNFDIYQPFLDHEVGHDLGQKEELKNKRIKNKEIKNISSFLSREQELIFIEKIFNDENFFLESSKTLKINLDDCKARFNKLKDMWLAQEQFHKNEQDYRGHLLNSVSYSLNAKSKTNGKEQSAKNSDKYAARRGTDVSNANTDYDEPFSV